MRSHHEHLRSKSDSAPPSDRGFGVVMAAALSILSWWKYEEWGWQLILWLIAFAIAMGLPPGSCPARYAR